MAGHVTIYPSKTAGWVGTEVHLVERTIKYPILPADFSTTQCVVMEPTMSGQQKSVVYEFNTQVLTESRRVNILKWYTRNLNSYNNVLKGIKG